MTNIQKIGIFLAICLVAMMTVFNFSQDKNNEPPLPVSIQDFTGFPNIDALIKSENSLPEKIRSEIRFIIECVLKNDLEKIRQNFDTSAITEQRFLELQERSKDFDPSKPYDVKPVLINIEEIPNGNGFKVLYNLTYEIGSEDRYFLINAALIDKDKTILEHLYLHVSDETFGALIGLPEFKQ